MPLTPCHAAAAWPLSRLAPGLPLAALVVGCMAPDFGYVLRLAPRGGAWHTLPGLVTLAVPAGTLVWLAWRALVRPAVRETLPPGLRPALDAPPLRARGFVAGVAAVALGAVSHVAWDGFTHGDGWAVARWPFLAAPLASGLATVPVYKVLQHGSTVLGAAVLLGWAARWWRRQSAPARAFAPGQSRASAAAWAAVLGVGLLGAMLNALRAPPSLALRLGFAAVGGMAALAVASLLWGARHALRRAGPRTP